MYGPAEEATWARTPKSGNRILLVDDEPDFTFSLKEGLEKEGFKVDSFNDPQEALSDFKADFTY